MTYCGFLREQNGDWQLVCRASTWDACWRALAAIEPRSLNAEKLVLPAGRHPDARKRPR